MFLIGSQTAGSIWTKLGTWIQFDPQSVLVKSDVLTVNAIVMRKEAL